MQYTNTTNIPLPLAVFLATDDYDYQPDTISVTTLLKPIKQIILGRRLEKEDRFTDISGLVASRMGSAIHTAIEKAWTNPQRALKLLGYPQSVIDKVIINPTKDQLKPDSIPVYMEQRTSKSIIGNTITGKYDFIAEGRVEDFKSTGVYSYLNQTNRDKYILQGSLYRWLNPDIITKDDMRINYIFTDWNKLESIKNKNYPANRVLTQVLSLKSIKETETYVRNKLSQIKKYEDSPESEIPMCNDEELWRKPAVWKYYKNPAKTERSTANFDNPLDATIKFNEDGGCGLIKEVKGQIMACKYCPAFSICQQKEIYLESGELVL